MIELLAPAGSFEKMRFAIAYGADAIYAGVPLFSLRARENEFKHEILEQAVSYCHSHGRKIYFTMNIYAHNNRIDRFLQAFEQYSAFSPDGFIMADAGLINKCLKLNPDAVIHLSTQANATNWTTVEFWQDIGIKRIILPRELSVSEIATIRNQVRNIELEVFVHGSVCIAYSGRCLISNYLNHRNANDGTCTNSCRWKYSLQWQAGNLKELEYADEETSYEFLKGRYSVTEAKRSAICDIPEKFEIDEDENGTYLMNSKDLCAIELLSELQNAGVCSFKIEGRTKSVYYLSIITRAYRRAMNDLLEGKTFNAENLREVMSTSNRTLMTGFFLKKPKNYGENFEDGESVSHICQFCGQVVDYDSSTRLAFVHLRNKICLGDEIEWISPEINTKACLTTILDHKKETKKEISGGLYGWINSPIEPCEFTLIRRNRLV